MIIGVSNNKGGILKSTSTVNLASLYYQQGRRVLVVDADNQGNVAISWGINPDDMGVTIYDVLAYGTPADEAIMRVEGEQGDGPCVDLLGANDDMALFDFDILTNIKRFPEPFQLLRRALDPIRDQYDIILIDAPPNMGLMQGNTLTASDYILIPFQPEKYSMRSLVKIMQAADDFKTAHNPDLEILGVFSTLVDKKTVLHRTVMKQAHSYLARKEIRMFDTFIPRSIKYAASVGLHSKPLAMHAPKDKLVKKYQELIKEIEQAGIIT